MEGRHPTTRSEGGLRWDAIGWRGATAAELVAGAREGREEAWNEIHRRFTPSVRSKLAEIDPSPAQIDDALQATWLKLTTSIDSIRQPERLVGWLRTTARNEAIDLIRRDARLIYDDNLDEQDRPQPGPDAPMLTDLIGEEVRAAVETLTDRERELVRLRYLADEPASYAQISKRLDIRHGAIGPTLRRALDRMSTHPRIVALR